MIDLQRPERHLDDMAKLYPDIQPDIDYLLGERDHGLPNWPGWCYLPLYNWYAIVSSQTKADTLASADIAEVDYLAAIHTWGLRESIDLINPDDVLRTLPLLDPMPANKIITEFPRYCTYIPTPGWMWFDHRLWGAYVHLNVREDDQPELCFVLDTDDGFKRQSLPLGPWTVEEAVGHIASVATVDNPDLMRTIAKEVSPLLAAVITICNHQ